MYRTHELSIRGGGSRRTWLAAGGALAAVLVLLALVVAACSARSNRVDAQVGTAGGAAVAAAASPTASAGDPAAQVADPTGGGQPGAGGGDQGGGGQPGAGGGDQGGGDQGGGDEDQDGDGGADPPAPLAIEVTVDTVTPGGQCFAAGTIVVSGGSYPLTVHYQWRRLVVAGGFEGEPVSAVHNVSLDQPGAVSVQTDALPEDGTNVMLIVTGPKPTGSGAVGYDGCSDGPGGIAPPGS